MPAEDRPTIVHVAQIEISRESGMGRVAWHWRQALEERGFAFRHIGPRETGRVHPAFFPYAAWLRARRLVGPRPAAFLVHEPNGVPFIGTGIPTFVFSHGLERRGWETTLAAGAPIRARSRLLFPLWRLRQADFSLRRARAVLVLNRDDLAEVQRRYGRRREDVFLFQNGVDPLPPMSEMSRVAPEEPPTVLFLGSWLARKGTATLAAAAAALLHRRGIAARFLLAGTGIGEAEVLAAWPEELRGAVRVLPSFPAAEEAALFAAADLFVLPSLFEGQPLALLQAMAAGRCCLAADIPGPRDLIDHRRTGLLHTAGDAGQLAEQMAECLANPALRDELGSAARNLMAGRAWSAVAGEVADFIAEILASPGRRP